MSNYIMDLRKLVGHRPLLQVGASVIVEDAEGRILLQLRSDNLCWGYAGGSVELDEVEKLEEVLPLIWDELSPEARAVIEEQGVVYTDCEGDLVTSIVNNKDCVFTCYDDKGCCYCAIEKAYREGRTNFYKPISCHLYPIRVGNYGLYKAVNYHRWDVCKAAILLGQKENLPVYKFLKEPLIRKFGEDWYAELELVVEEMKKQGIL